MRPFILEDKAVKLSKIEETRLKPWQRIARARGNLKLPNDRGGALCDVPMAFKGKQRRWVYLVCSSGEAQNKKSDNRLQKFKERGYPLNGVPLGETEGLCRQPWKDHEVPASLGEKQSFRSFQIHSSRWWMEITRGSHCIELQRAKGDEEKEQEAHTLPLCVRGRIRIHSPGDHPFIQAFPCSLACSHSVVVAVELNSRFRRSEKEEEERKKKGGRESISRCIFTRCERLSIELNNRETSRRVSRPCLRDGRESREIAD